MYCAKKRVRCRTNEEILEIFLTAEGGARETRERREKGRQKDEGQKDPALYI